MSSPQELDLRGSSSRLHPIRTADFVFPECVQSSRGFASFHLSTGQRLPFSRRQSLWSRDPVLVHRGCSADSDDKKQQKRQVTCSVPFLNIYCILFIQNYILLMLQNMEFLS